MNTVTDLALTRSRKWRMVTRTTEITSLEMVTNWDRRLSGLKKENKRISPQYNPKPGLEPVDISQKKRRQIHRENDYAKDLQKLFIYPGQQNRQWTFLGLI